MLQYVVKSIANSERSNWNYVPSWCRGKWTGRDDFLAGTFRRWSLFFGFVLICYFVDFVCDYCYCCVVCLFVVMPCCFFSCWVGVFVVLFVVFLSVYLVVYVFVVHCSLGSVLIYYFAVFFYLYTTSLKNCCCFFYCKSVY